MGEGANERLNEKVGEGREKTEEVSKRVMSGWAGT